MNDEEKAATLQKAELLEIMATRLREPLPDSELTDAAAGQLEQWARELRVRTRSQ